MPSPYWLIVVIVAIFGVALLARRRGDRAPAKPRESSPRVPPPLAAGERYDESVKLATLPNVPLADLWCQRLRDEGIEAYYTASPVTPAFVGEGGPRWNPALPVELRVGAHDLARARELFPELA